LFAVCSSPPKVKEISKGVTAYSLAAGSQVRAESLFAVPSGSEDVAILCLGPNPVYYHTEGHPPGLGDNDSGDIAVNQKARFKITAAIIFSPDVYVAVRYGPTRFVVAIGPTNLDGIKIDF
jgi:hypothetical protein